MASRVAPILRAARGACYSRWPRAGSLVDGCTVLMPVPGDLPVFLELALATFGKQELDERVETIVIPDRMTPGLAAAFERSRREHPCGPVRLVQIGPFGRLQQRTTRGGPGLNHFLQLYHGVAATRTSHALLHDADLFLLDRNFLARRFERVRAEGLAFAGVEERYDDWFARRGFGPVSASWELLFDVRRLREFRPWDLHGHDHVVDGERHYCDTLDYVQLRTPAERRAVWEAPDGYLHFNWAISVYRYFQAAEGEPFNDHRFLILLLRLLSDAFVHTDGATPHGDLPPVAELARGIADDSAPVTYRTPSHPEKYGDFRRLIRQLIDAELIEPARADDIDRALSPFDAAFA